MFKCRLKQDPGANLREFCHEHHINYSGMKSWYSHHDISIRGLRKEAASSSMESDGRQPLFVQVIPKDRPAGEPIGHGVVRGAGITLPGGIRIGLQECGVEELATLLAMCSAKMEGRPCSD